MKEHLKDRILTAGSSVRRFLSEEKGETNIIAIILIILVVIVLAAIFKQQLTSIVNSLFGQIRDSLGL